MLILIFFHDNILVMALFLLVLFPCVLGLYFFQSVNGKKYLVAFAGCFSAVVYCTAAGLFSSAFRLVPYSFFSNFLFYFLTQAFIPLVLLNGIFFIWSKDSLEYKIDSFFPLIFLFMIMSLFFMIKIIYNFLLNDSKNKYLFFVLMVFAFFIFLIIPAVADALFIITDNYFLVSLIALISGGFQAFMYFMFLSKK